jgi:hypothetical protein
MKPGARAFSIKGGQCHLYPDRIEVRRSDGVGRLTEFLFRRGYQRAIILYLLLALGLLLAALLAFSIDNYFLTSFLGAMALIAAGYAWTNRDLSFAPVIPKRSVEATQYRRAVQGEARAAFIIYFRPGKHLLRRVILLPTRTHQGTSLADTAYWMMRDEGLIE